MHHRVHLIDFRTNSADIETHVDDVQWDENTSTKEFNLGEDWKLYPRYVKRNFLVIIRVYYRVHAREALEHYFCGYFIHGISLIQRNNYEIICTGWKVGLK